MAQRDLDQLVDLDQLATRESEQTEWKANVADIDDVAKTLSAFANDLPNLGGGYVVCGAEEGKDEHGFQSLTRSGLTAHRLKEVENNVLARCRDRVSPSIAPLVVELPAGTADRRILVFIQPATPFAHTARIGDKGARYYARIGRSTVEARNGILRDLLVRKGAVEPWDRRLCQVATDRDLDLLALRDALQRMRAFSADLGIEPYLSDGLQLSPFVPSLCIREPLTNVLRPRNFAILLFGRDIQKFIPGASSIFSVYPGADRSDPHAERYELAGTLIDQAQRLSELLEIQSTTAFDKLDRKSPNAIKYPKRALYEAMGNALAHRDYELADPTRVTVFSDRIEILSPGSLPLGVDPVAFREGRSGPKWRNQALAWFFTRLQFAQAEGQGIPTILRTMQEEGCPPPIFDATSIHVTCVLPAHPRHALLRDLREIEQAIALGELTRAQNQVKHILERDPLNYRALLLFAEVQQALRDPEPLFDFLQRHINRLDILPSSVLLQLSETLVAGDQPKQQYQELARKLLSTAARGRLEERELRRIGVALLRARDEEKALSLVDSQLTEHPEWKENASLLQLRGDAMLGLAGRCRWTAKRREIAQVTRQRAWRQFHDYLIQAERDLQRALALSVDAGLSQVIRRNIEYLDRLRRENQPYRGGRS